MVFNIFVINIIIIIFVQKPIASNVSGHRCGQCFISWRKQCRELKDSAIENIMKASDVSEKMTTLLGFDNTNSSFSYTNDSENISSLEAKLDTIGSIAITEKIYGDKLRMFNEDFINLLNETADLSPEIVDEFENNRDELIERIVNLWTSAQVELQKKLLLLNNDTNDPIIEKILDLTSAINKTMSPLTIELNNFYQKHKYEFAILVEMRNESFSMVNKVIQMNYVMSEIWKLRREQKQFTFLETSLRNQCVEEMATIEDSVSKSSASFMIDVNHTRNTVSLADNLIHRMSFVNNNFLNNFQEKRQQNPFTPTSTEVDFENVGRKLDEMNQLNAGLLNELTQGRSELELILEILLDQPIKDIVNQSTTRTSVELFYNKQQIQNVEGGKSIATTQTTNQSARSRWIDPSLMNKLMVASDMTMMNKEQAAHEKDDFHDDDQEQKQTIINNNNRTSWLAKMKRYEELRFGYEKVAEELSSNLRKIEGLEDEFASNKLQFELQRRLINFLNEELDEIIDNQTIEPCKNLGHEFRKQQGVSRS